jgi:GDP-L-fucose synthase
MHYAWENGVKRFLYTGSVCEYPQMKKPKKEEMVWDGEPVQNDNVTGLVKRIGEIQARAYLLQHGWDAVRIVRPSNIYGPHDVFDADKGQCIPALIKKAFDAEKELEVWGDGQAIRDFVYVDDVVKGILLATIAEKPLAVNLSGTWTKIEAVVDIIVKKINKNLEIKWNADKPSGDPVRKLCGEKARKLIGYAPSVTLNKGIKRTINWYLKYGDKYVR